VSATVPRRQQILEALARELESNPGTRITTAGLAKAVGISEAALYRHFPSKAKMFESLIEFSEDTIFGLANRIHSEETTTEQRCAKLLHLILGFSDRNPGITRVLLGDALVGEHERLQARVGQFYERIEIQLKQFLREGVMHDELPSATNVPAMANLLMAFAEGRMSQFVRSRFKRRPLDMWNDEWTLMQRILFAHRKRPETELEAIDV
jgi:TetR/AcrR family transcriptional regulator